MPGMSSIYWNSVDSQRSSGDSSGDIRNYVDPWDLENHAYLQQHGLATPIYESHQPRTGPSRLSHRSRTEPDYWYAPSIKEPGYDAPASTEELYFGTSRKPSNSCYYRQPIYEDEVSQYAAPIPAYIPLSELEHIETIEDYGMMEMKMIRIQLERAGDQKRREGCVYHGLPAEAPRDFEDMIPPRKTEVNERYVEVIPPSHLGLNTYGHLKIDYTNSWNSLHRKIREQGQTRGVSKRQQRWASRYVATNEIL
ncbi:uncharacterized protein LOC117167814 [Belonocnema kinseyi]|uniref:uncharacterized protein LOC117167814 n=1 Tax=Belonocnema kinseyi TaxID=2817044 RepID=UPI00143CD81F|nr:uncharacterized protein LOC117167814 [Belonocnema kinseyi]